METWQQAWILGGILARQCRAAQARLGKGRDSHLEALAQRLFRLQGTEVVYRLALAGALDGEGALPAPLAADPKEHSLALAAGLEGGTRDPAALAYLMGYAKALDPLHRPPEAVWQRVLPDHQRLDSHFSRGASDALGQVLFPRMIEAGIDPERIRQAMKSLESTDLLIWAHAQLNPELAQRYPKRLARIAARLGSRAEA